MKKLKNLSFKIYFLIIMGLIAIGVIISFSFYAKKYYFNSYSIMYNLNRLENAENRLNYNLLYSSLFLYYNNDKISKKINRIRALIEELESNEFFKSHYKDAYKDFLNYKKAFERKEDLIFEFMRYNLPIKNSLIYLANSLKFMKLDSTNIKYVMNVLSSIFLSKNTGDLVFLKEIGDLKELEKFKNSPDEYKKAFIRNLMIYIKYYPLYRKYLYEIINSSTYINLKSAFKKFKTTLNRDLELFKILSYILIIFIITLIGLLILVVLRLDEKIRDVYFLLEHDSLTGLKNRYKLNKDIKKIDTPAVILFNIDKFKNINDYFGSKIGDKLLNDVGNNLKNFFKNFDTSIELYRVGADDFAAVLDGKKYKDNELEKIAKKAIDMLEGEEFKYNKTTLNINLSAGISTKEPYLENADMALKQVKKDIKEKIKFFKKNLNNDIEKNIKKSKEIKEAIESNRIIPYYQPIFDKDKNIYKYEVLCRVIINESNIKSIYEYLDILKENKMYHKITQIILKYSLEKLKEFKDLNLSINLSVEDVLNRDVVNFIKKEFTKQDIAKRITFEILESEVENYEALKEFIKKMKKYGIKFAIDDFGSGYSNFSRVLKLDIDYLKIDGSLIKNIVEDKDSQLIVKTIISFAKSSNKKTVAEFVHSKEVFEMTKAMGVDYFQGYYLSEPKPNINL